MWNKFLNNEKGFTGLEAAIVLVAFVVVAAVFSYVMLGAGFYTTQKSQEVVHTGVAQASSSVELSGDVISCGADGELKNLTMFLQLTSGGSPVDVNQTLIVFTSRDHKPTDLKNGPTYEENSMSNYTVAARYNDNEDYLIDKLEKFEVRIPLAPYNITANEEFQLEIKPPQGATYTIHRQAPASITTQMVLN
ncbi:flagellin [Methanosarcina sp. 2.H.T.1A.6]|uniref:archaellin/type IV pilin N-terminal domain-containing protein n=1 Tax=unclassified Methanosarcina TaxID=2644672 RepID=UPI00062129CE|nr:MULTISPECIES: archaellin/type IV pilin N-terminal domain-containing protein [unclassified Methanosarcina]KKG15614.1 flagellin [Methanosarcina sp. 2.H.T.1A.3]KKG19524.1 flagellin [Methanosarcina sp. 2.H.T.1A.6]KKG27515.1 flagellin [Methanosarcina sp. 2.H.T.1A.8]KKG28448.1 flagellin [Methanosarcina sp. 2.H.T.1A.15]